MRSIPISIARSSFLITDGYGEEIGNGWNARKSHDFTQVQFDRLQGWEKGGMGVFKLKTS